MAQHNAAQADRESAEAKLHATRAQLAAAEAQVEKAQAQVHQAQAALDQTRVDLDRTLIRSPVTGTVISRSVDVGQTVAASLQAPTLFTIAQDLTKMQVDTNVSEADIGQIVVGQHGDVYGRCLSWADDARHRARDPLSSHGGAKCGEL